MSMLHNTFVLIAQTCVDERDERASLKYQWNQYNTHIQVVVSKW